jgi:hypothetical protein
MRDYHMFRLESISSSTLKYIVVGLKDKWYLIGSPQDVVMRYENALSYEHVCACARKTAMRYDGWLIQSTEQGLSVAKSLCPLHGKFVFVGCSLLLDPLILLVLEANENDAEACGAAILPKS